MSMASPFVNCCRINYHNAPLAEYDPSSPPPNTDFLVNIHAKLMHVPFHIDDILEEEDLQDMPSFQYQVETFYESFNTKSELLIREDHAPCASNIANMLSEVNVTDYDSHEGIIREISKAARRMAAGKQLNGSDKSSLMIMTVFIELVVFEDEEDFDEYVDDEEGELGGANKAAVEALEKVTVKEEGNNQGLLHLHECAICLEVIHVGSEGIRMPCSHIFHGGCILRWLEKSKVCPYCRFKMP